MAVFVHFSMCLSTFLCNIFYHPLYRKKSILVTLEHLHLHKVARELRFSFSGQFLILPPPSSNAAPQVRVEEKIKSLGFCSDIYHIPCIYNITSLPSRLLQLCNSTFPTLTRSHVAAENSVRVSDRAAVSISHLRVEISTLTVEFEKSKP